MHCPFCHHRESRVLESRVVESEDALRRRRECLDCQRRYTTYERVVEHPVSVIKKDGRRELFNRQKLVEGVLRACIHTTVERADVEALVESIETEIANRPTREATSVEIGQMVLSRLRKLNEVAYVRFASVYRHFATVDDFIRELKGLSVSVPRT